MVDMRSQREVDERIAQNVRTLLAHTGIPREDVIDVLGISRSTWYDRMGAKSPWTAAEVAAVAVAFDIEVADMYSSTPTLPPRRYVVRSRPRTGWSAGDHDATGPGALFQRPKRRPKPRHYVYGLHQRAESFHLAPVA